MVLAQARTAIVSLRFQQLRRVIEQLPFDTQVSLPAGIHLHSQRAGARRPPRVWPVDLPQFYWTRRFGAEKHDYSIGTLSEMVNVGASRCKVSVRKPVIPARFHEPEDGQEENH